MVKEEVGECGEGKVGEKFGVRGGKRKIWWRRMK